VTGVCRPRLLIAVLSGLLLSGCGKVRYPRNYILNLPPAPSQIANPRAALGPVVVSRFRCRDYVCQGRIVYRQSPEEVGYYEYDRWAADPRESITSYVVYSLRNAGLFNEVATQELGIKPAYILTGSIERLEEVDLARDITVVCALSAQLMDAGTGSVVWSGTASETLAVEQRDVAGVVRRMSSAVQAAVDQLMKSMAKQLGTITNARPGASR
jgi:ABC-type uncharacterized transport system auxiliary subunit